MSLFRQLSRGLRNLANRRAADRDIAEEVDAYLQQAACRAALKLWILLIGVSLCHLNRGRQPRYDT